jgi:NAD(P)H-nitrite reductase large subunit
MHIVVAGSGIAGISFAEEMRKLVPEAKVTVLTRETHGYYSRPLLSHGFTREDIETRIILRSFAALAEAGIEIKAGVDVHELRRDEKAVVFCGPEGEVSLAYDKLILALGSEALIPPPFAPYHDLFHVVNSLDDVIALRRLRAQIRQSGAIPRWAVVGGGLIGCEVAADLATAGDQVALFHALPRLMERQLVEADSQELRHVMTQTLRVEVHLDAPVSGFEDTAHGIAVTLADRQEAGFDGLILACGFKPRTHLAAAGGLEIGRGIRVNGYLQTTDPDIFAIGDVAELPDGRLYAYVTPVRSQALWLAKHLGGPSSDPWAVPAFKPKAKIPGFNAQSPYLF